MFRLNEEAYHRQHVHQPKNGQRWYNDGKPVSTMIITASLLIHLIFWILGFLFLFRIPYCKRAPFTINHRNKISVIIPARNEENNLLGLLSSLRRQDSIPHEIIVVDDFSEDQTKQIAEQEGMIVLSSAPHPEGWKGKTWVCYQGALIATGDILVFLDADTTLEKDGLRRMIETYVQLTGILSIQPFHKMKRLYEELSAFFNIIVMGAMGSFTILGNKIKPAGLFGPVLIVSKETYLQYGGHSIAKSEIMEHMSYGSLIKEKGETIYCYGGKHTISFRMYPNGIGDLINGWSKGFASGAMQTSIPILIMIVLWIVGAFGTTRIFIQECIAGDTSLIIQWGLLYVFYVMQMYWMIRRIGNFKIYTASFYPISLLFFVVVFIYSLLRIFVFKKTIWKGRTINI